MKNAPGSNHTANTLENTLIKRLAQDFYPQLLNGFKDAQSKMFPDASRTILRHNALQAWTSTIQRLNERKNHPELVQHIKNNILPKIEASDPNDTLFLVLFIRDRLAMLKRAWCPTEEDDLKKLGFPYDLVEPVTHGLDGILGLSKWEVPLTDEVNVGLKAGFQHQYRHDLTRAQFEGHTYTPEGDWLIGIRSSLYLGIPVDSKPTERFGQLCVCSPVPGMFGNVDITEELNTTFFGDFGEIIKQATDIQPFSEAFGDLARYRETSALEMATAWKLQMFGLTHKHRRDFNYLELRPCELLEKFFDFASNRTDFKKLVQHFNQGFAPFRASSATFRTEVGILRNTIQGTRRFYEFLRNYSQISLHAEGSVSRKEMHQKRAITKTEFISDPTRKISFPTFRDFKKWADNLAFQAAKGLRRSHRLLRWTGASNWEPIIDLAESGAIEYIIFQLLENAIKYAPRGDRVIAAARARRDPATKAVELQFIVENCLQPKFVTKSPKSACSQCGQIRSQLASFKDAYLCKQCFPVVVSTFLRNGNWRSPQLSQRYGLFLIYRFISDFYGGSLEANAGRIPGALIPGSLKVTFRLTLPVRSLDALWGD
jgi:hypothetical protein